MEMIGSLGNFQEQAESDDEFKIDDDDDADGEDLNTKNGNVYIPLKERRRQQVDDVLDGFD